MDFDSEERDKEKGVGRPKRYTEIHRWRKSQKLEEWWWRLKKNEGKQLEWGKIDWFNIRPLLLVAVIRMPLHAPSVEQRHSALYFPARFQRRSVILEWFSRKIFLIVKNQMTFCIVSWIKLDSFQQSHLNTLKIYTVYYIKSCTLTYQYWTNIYYNEQTHQAEWLFQLTL